MTDDDRTQGSDGGPEQPSVDDSSRGITFRLPPIQLPPLFPDQLRIVLPLPGYRHGRSLSAGWVLVVALVFDALDATLALTATGPVDLVRTGGGTVLAVLATGWMGGLYVVELIAVILGVPAVTAFPSLAVLAFVRMGVERRRQPERET